MSSLTLIRHPSWFLISGVEEERHTQVWDGRTVLPLQTVLFGLLVFIQCADVILSNEWREFICDPLLSVDPCKKWPFLVLPISRIVEDPRILI